MDPMQLMVTIQADEGRKKSRVEVMQYSPEDLDEGWEFKVVRGGPDAFSARQSLDHLMAQESRAGWIMLEKLDDSRVRFKRPAAAKQHDTSLPAGIDPYRTDLTSPPAWWALLLVIGVLGGIALMLAESAVR